MEGASVLSPSSWERRRAWARQSRCWRSTALEEEAAAAARDAPELQPPHLDDVFLEGSCSSKIETWLQECGSSVEMVPEELGLPGACGCGTSFEDDLTLGAEALLLSRNDKAVGRAPQDKHLNLGHSMASSALSSITNKTSSSISEVLEWWQADAEEILYNLGFVQSEPEDVARIPARFFSAPSQAKGIDFHLFLKSQMQRMEMEDPCLMLASRFQQVQALAATADAFFCLYSYVSKTPVQRISPARLAWACSDMREVRVAAAEPRAVSPAERLQKAVSRMCLYTAPSARRPGALGRVVHEALERARAERLRCSPAGTERSQGATAEMPLTSQRPGQGPSLCPLGGRDLPACPQGGRGLVPRCCRGERAWPPRSSPPGTPSSTTTGRVERPCPHCQGSGDSPRAVAPLWAQRAEDSPYPSGAEDNQTGPAATQECGTVSPGLDCAATTAGWTGDPPKQPAGLEAEGDSGFGSDSLGTSPWANATSQRCPSKTSDLCAPCAPCPDRPKPVGRGDQRRKGQSGMCHPRDTAWKEEDVSGLQVLGTQLPPSASWSEMRSHLQVESFEMEEVLSAGEDDADAREEAGCSLAPCRTIRRGFMLHANSGRSDSSGFVEELVATVPPSVPLHSTASLTVPRLAVDPPGTLQAPGGLGDPWDSDCP